MARSNLTSRQAAILDYIKKELNTHGYPPSVREIGQALGIASTSTVHNHLNNLEAKGYIRRDPQKPRAMEILDTDDPDTPMLYQTEREMVDIPILGRISAGLPIYAEENTEDHFPVPLDFLHSNKQLFMLRVQGESMIEVGIEDGDLLIVESASTARNGEMVVALIEDEATVKTFYREPSRIRLQPENQHMKPIYVDNCQIIGKPIGLIRHF